MHPTRIASYLSDYPMHFWVLTSKIMIGYSFNLNLREELQYVVNKDTVLTASLALALNWYNQRYRAISVLNLQHNGERYWTGFLRCVVQSPGWPPLMMPSDGVTDVKAGSFHINKLKSSTAVDLVGPDKRYYVDVAHHVGLLDVHNGNLGSYSRI